jgi:hypothetical protein
MSSVGARDALLDRCNETETAGFSLKVALSKLGSAPTFGGRPNLTDPLRLARTTGTKFTQPEYAAAHDRHTV